MQLYPDICMIVSASGHMYALPLIQCVNDMLLDGLVFFIVQGVEFNGLCKDLLKFIADRRQWIGNDGKTVGFAWDISVGDLTGFHSIIYIQGILLVGILGICLLVDRRKWFFAKNFHNRRTAKGQCLVFFLFKGIAHHFQAALYKGFIKIICFVILVIIVKLAVWRYAVIATFATAPAVK